MNIRVLIAEASPFRANVLSRVLQRSPRATAVGIAANGEEAILLAHRLKPDVIILDVSLPAIRGPLATRQILDHAPSRILITAEPDSLQENAMAFLALDEGAIDLLSRPATVLEEGPPGFARSFVRRIEVVARARFWSRPQPAETHPASEGESRSERGTQRRSRSQLIVMMGGVGGVQAGTHLLRRLPASFRGSILMMQSLEEGFLDGYARWLKKETRFNAEVCRRPQVLKPRTIYLAPESAHLVLRNETTVAPSRAKPVRGHRPSLVALCRSVIQYRPEGATAVALSGEGEGVDGFKLLRKGGGVVLAQEPRSCLVPDLVEHAVAADAVDAHLPLEELVTRLMQVEVAGGKTRTA